MKIYEIIADSDHFQVLCPVNPELAPEVLRFECLPRVETWVPPAVRRDHTDRPAPDFWRLADGALVAGPRAIDLDNIRTTFDMAGEDLLLPLEDQELIVLNVTQCVNMLDAKRCQWITAPDGTRIAPSVYAFFGNRTHNSSIFKLPETRRSNVLCWELERDPEGEFKAAVEDYGLTGLLFREIWSDGQSQP